MSTEEKPLEERMAELRAKKDAIDAAREVARKVRAVEEMELEVRFDGELGSRGTMFELVDSGDLDEGFIVVKLGPEVLWKRFTSSKTTNEDVHELVRPCVVHPSPAKYDEIVARRPALGVRAANALATLFGVKSETNAGK